MTGQPDDGAVQEGVQQAFDGTEGPAEVDRPSLAARLEAVLLVVDEPAGVEVLAASVDAPAADVVAALDALAGDYERSGRGFRLLDRAGGWRFYTAEECAPWVERHVVDGNPSKLSTAALETLAVVAYRQPVTRGRVAAIRGVNVDGVMRTLVSRGLVEEAGTDDVGGALTYRTTPLFLEKAGLRSTEDLPPLAPLLPDVEDVLREGDHA